MEKGHFLKPRKNSKETLNNWSKVLPLTAKKHHKTTIYCIIIIIYFLFNRLVKGPMLTCRQKRFTESRPRLTSFMPMLLHQVS